jgi:hypothetical protein
MSGVNRNTLKNTGIPLFGDVTPPEVNLVTTSGSRWVLLDFLNTTPTSSNGSCTSIGLEWSPDPSMVTNPFQPSSSYYAVTSSTFSCLSSSLSPQTGSEAWIQFIDSYWLRTPQTPAGIPTEYYLRSFQTRNTTPVTIYSPVVAVQTRAEAYCGETYTSSLVTPYIVADMDGFNSPGFSNKWMNDVGDGTAPNQSASFSTGIPTVSGSTNYLIKAGGPNYDAFRMDGSSQVSFPQVASMTDATVRAGVGIVKGRARFVVNSNGNNFLVSINADSVATTGSITVTKPSTSEVVGTIDAQYLPLNLVNSYVEIILAATGISEIRVDNNNVGTFDLRTYGAAGTVTIPTGYPVTIDSGSAGTGGNYGIIRALTAQVPYNPTVYHCKYGPIGAGSYTP